MTMDIDDQTASFVLLRVFSTEKEMGTDFTPLDLDLISCIIFNRKNPVKKITLKSLKFTLDGEYHELLVELQIDSSTFSCLKVAIR